MAPVPVRVKVVAGVVSAASGSDSATAVPPPFCALPSKVKF